MAGCCSGPEFVQVRCLSHLAISNVATTFSSLISLINHQGNSNSSEQRAQPTKSQNRKSCLPKRHTGGGGRGGLPQDEAAFWAPEMYLQINEAVRVRVCVSGASRVIKLEPARIDH